MNESILQTRGGILLISQFTLLGNMKKGTRPSFNGAAQPDLALKPSTTKQQKPLSSLHTQPVQTGQFAADMQIDASNDGPVTLILDSKKQSILMLMLFCRMCRGGKPLLRDK